MQDFMGIVWILTNLVRWSYGNMNVIPIPSPGLGRLRVGGLASQAPQINMLGLMCPSSNKSINRFYNSILFLKTKCLYGALAIVVAPNTNLIL